LPLLPAETPAPLNAAREPTIDSSLLFGLLLIAGGFALGAAAVYLLYPRRPAAEGENPSPDTAPPPTVPREPSSETELELPAESAAPVDQTVAAPSSQTPADVPGETPMSDQVPPAPAVPERQLLPVVTLLRDEVTGTLALQVGPRVYTHAQALRDSADWTRVEYAARDLARWLEGGPQPPRRPEERRPEAPAKSGTMVEQINRILEAKLAAHSASGRGVRLVEGQGGAVRVFIGVQSYDLEEVPDPDVRAAIREAVAEWEAAR